MIRFRKAFPRELAIRLWFEYRREHFRACQKILLPRYAVQHVVSHKCTYECVRELLLNYECSAKNTCHLGTEKSLDAFDRAEFSDKIFGRVSNP